MVKVLTYDIPDHKIKLKIRQFPVTGKNIIYIISICDFFVIETKYSSPKINGLRKRLCYFLIKYLDKRLYFLVFEEMILHEVKYFKVENLSLSQDNFL